jgi:hypothetical protein
VCLGVFFVIVTAGFIVLLVKQGNLSVLFRKPTDENDIEFHPATHASKTDDHFGYSVSISGDTVVVGAYQDASNATGVKIQTTIMQFGQEHRIYL